MKVPKKIHVYDTISFDPVEFCKEHVPEFAESESSTAFCDLSAVSQRLHVWQENCPNICPILVLRRNYDSRILKMAASFNCRFACSSRGEVEELLRMNISHENIIWSNSNISIADCRTAEVAQINSIQVGRVSALENLKLSQSNAG